MVKKLKRTGTPNSNLIQHTVPDNSAYQSITFLADRTNGRAIGAVLCPSVVYDTIRYDRRVYGMYCG